jgi:hypothetical protein
VFGPARRPPPYLGRTAGAGGRGLGYRGARLHAPLASRASPRRASPGAKPKPGQYYAFPYGSYDRRTLRALAEAGYAAGLSVHTGPATPASDWRRLPRLEVTADCDLATFRQLVRTGYTSPGAKYRARLRDWAYRVPAVHDALLAATGR